MAPQPPLPPKPPNEPPTRGGAVSRSQAGAAINPGSSVASVRKSIELARPPWVPFALCGVLFVAGFISTFGVSRNNTTVHSFAAVFGMFGSIVILGWFRQELNVRRSTGSFSEWPGPWESTKYMWLLVTFVWLSGALNVYFAVYELARPE